MKVENLYKLLDLIGERNYALEIIRKSGLSWKHVYTSIKLFKERGLVEGASNLDMRRKYIRLTEKGRKVLEGLRWLYETEKII